MKQAQTKCESLILYLPNMYGTLQSFVDYRVLNAVKIRDSYRISCMDICIESLRHATKVSTSDTSRRYWRVKIAKRGLENDSSPVASQPIWFHVHSISIETSRIQLNALRTCNHKGYRAACFELLAQYRNQFANATRAYQSCPTITAFNQIRGFEAESGGLKVLHNLHPFRWAHYSPSEARVGDADNWCVQWSESNTWLPERNLYHFLPCARYFTY